MKPLPSKTVTPRPATASTAPVTGRAAATFAARLTFDNVERRYGETCALAGFSLDIVPGEVVCLLGPSGCGKTTLLRVASGIEKPSGGRVLINDREVAGPNRFVPPEDRGIGLMFQDFALFPHLTILRNVAFGLELRGVAKSEREAIAEKYITDVGLQGFENKHPHELSGGMRQRVGLARALSVDAQVMLMDEPFAAVDEQTRRKFQEDLLNLVNHENKTFIFVTHSIEEAVYVSDQIAILLPRPSRVSEIIKPEGFRHKDADSIRRDSEYLDIVDRIWSSLRTYVE